MLTVLWSDIEDALEYSHHWVEVDQYGQSSSLTVYLKISKEHCLEYHLDLVLDLVVVDILVVLARRR
jgi:hypothetical protein